MSRPKTTEDLDREASATGALCNNDPTTNIFAHIRTAERLPSAALLSLSQGHLDNAYVQFALCFHIVDRIVPGHPHYYRVDITQRESLTKIGMRCQTDFQAARLRIIERSRVWMNEQRGYDNRLATGSPGPPPMPKVVTGDEARVLWARTPQPGEKQTSHGRNARKGQEGPLPERPLKGILKKPIQHKGILKTNPRPPLQHPSLFTVVPSRPSSTSLLGLTLARTDARRRTQDESALSDADAEEPKEHAGHNQQWDTSMSTAATVGSEPDLDRVTYFQRSDSSVSSGSESDVEGFKGLHDLVAPWVLPQLEDIALPLPNTPPPLLKLLPQADRPVYLPREALRKFSSIIQIDVASDRASWGLLLGVLQQVQIPEESPFFQVTTLLIPPQPRDSLACGSLTSQDVDLSKYIEDSQRMILGWIHSHPNESVNVTSEDLHTQARYQSVTAESFAIIYGRSSYAIAKLSQPGLYDVQNCKEKSIFHEHLTVLAPDSSGRTCYQVAYTPADHIHFTTKSIEVVDLRRDLVESFAWTDRPSRVRKTAPVSKGRKGFTISDLPPVNNEGLGLYQSRKRDRAEAGEVPLTLLEPTETGTLLPRLSPRPLPRPRPSYGASPGSRMPPSSPGGTHQTRLPSPRGFSQRFEKSTGDNTDRPFPDTPTQEWSAPDSPEGEPIATHAPAVDLTKLLECNTSERKARGIYANIYEGLLKDNDTQIMSKVAVKMLKELKDTLPENRSQSLEERLKREVRMWQILTHERIIELLGFAYVGDLPCLVSPWCSKGNVQNFLRDVPLSSPIRTKFVRQIAEGLAYLHDQLQPVIHGNIKAENILINDSGDAMLSNFGLTKFYDERHTGMTTSYEYLDSLRWCAPELFSGSPRTISTDIYAFGAFALEVFTSMVPFCDVKIEARVVFMVGEGRIPQQDLYPPFPGLKEMWSMFQACWQRDPLERPTIQELMTQHLSQWEMLERSRSTTEKKHISIYISNDDSSVLLDDTTQIVLTVTPADQPESPGQFAPTVWKVLTFNKRSNFWQKVTWHSEIGFSSTITSENNVIIPSSCTHVRLRSWVQLMNIAGINKWIKPKPLETSQDLVMVKNVSGAPQSFALGSIRSDSPQEFEPYVHIDSVSHEGSITIGHPVMLQAYAVSAYHDSQLLSSQDQGKFLFRSDEGSPCPVDIRTLGDHTTFLLRSDRAGNITLRQE